MSKQHTLAGPAVCRGVGLHTGHDTTMTFVPAEPNTGLRFRRTDLDGSPVVPADVDCVQSTDRGTTLGVGDVQVHTVEHLGIFEAPAQVRQAHPGGGRLARLLGTDRREARLGDLDGGGQPDPRDLRSLAETRVAIFIEVSLVETLDDLLAHRFGRKAEVASSLVLGDVDRQ